MERRDFLRGGATLAAWSALWHEGWAADPAVIEANTGAPPKDLPPDQAVETRSGDMLYRTFGRTGERISAIGLGGHHIGLIKEEKDSIKLMRTAIDRGINFMDNSWDYHAGKSERWMGAALQDGYRDKVFLMTKIDGRTHESAAEQINESLKRLRVDVIDLMQIHENIRMEDADRCFADDGAIKALEEARKAGKIRYIGFTGHKDPAVHLRMLDVAREHQFQFDSCQMPINLLDASFRSFTKDVLPRLLEEKIAVLGMKPLASGGIVENKIATAQECLTYALSMPTSVVITGMESMDKLEQNLAIVKNFKPLTAQEVRTLVARTSAAAKTGAHERFKTSTEYDATAKNVDWLG